MSLAQALNGRAEKAQALRLDAEEEAHRLASLLHDSFKFEALYLFGSVLTRRFRRWSDIDMAIKGLKPQEFFKAHALLIQASPFDIDLKPFEDMPEDMKDKILRLGERIG